MKKTEYKAELLDAWEANYKKGQLTFWVFLALKEQEKFVDEIKEFVEVMTDNTLSCEEQSLYRTLRKYKELDMVDYESRPGNNGPERKYYFLTDLGKELLAKFIDRNINLFYKKEIKIIISKK